MGALTQIQQLCSLMMIEVFVLRLSFSDCRLILNRWFAAGMDDTPFSINSLGHSENSDSRKLHFPELTKVNGHSHVFVDFPPYNG